MSDPHEAEHRESSSEQDCHHLSVTCYSHPDVAFSIWACDTCRLRFYPACRTCVDVGHRVEHLDPTPRSEETE